MAVLTVFLKNGDILAFGTDQAQTNAAYDALLAGGTDYVELGTIFQTTPRFAIRKSEIVNLIHDPNDNTTVFASSALTRARLEQSRLQAIVPEVASTAAQAPESKRDGHTHAKRRD